MIFVPEILHNQEAEKTHRERGTEGETSRETETERGRGTYKSSERKTDVQQKYGKDRAKTGRSGSRERSETNYM